LALRARFPEKNNMPSLMQILLLLVIFLIAFVPPILVLSSKRAHGGAKFGWFIGAVVFSWIGYIVFMMVTSKDKETKV